MIDNIQDIEVATFGGGCFWCTEAVFSEIKGVMKVIPGYSGGNVPGHPTYREICSGLTGHAEVIQVYFDKNLLSFADLVEIFLTTHDPTTLNRQGADVGTQYRSVIFYHDETQKAIAGQRIAALSDTFDDEIKTELSPLVKFFEAEEEHKAYYANNPEQGYCRAVISPKLVKLRQKHADKLK